MTYLQLTDEVIEALASGKSVELSHPDLGREGRNGSVTLDTPGGLGSEMAIDPTFEIQS